MKIIKIKKFETIKVQTYELGEYLKNKKGLDLIRMDIEGHEIEVFDSLINFQVNLKIYYLEKFYLKHTFQFYKIKKNLF